MYTMQPIYWESLRGFHWKVFQKSHFEWTFGSKMNIWFQCLGRPSTKMSQKTCSFVYSWLMHTMQPIYWESLRGFHWKVFQKSHFECTFGSKMNICFQCLGGPSFKMRHFSVPEKSVWLFFNELWRNVKLLNTAFSRRANAKGGRGGGNSAKCSNCM